MNRVAICDDEPLICSQVEKYINMYAKESNEDFQVIKFQNGNQILKYLQKNYSIEIIFIDIFLSGENGMDIAKNIRSIDKKVNIIFLSSTEKYAIEGYSVAASNYFIKPASYYLIARELKKILNNLKFHNKDFFVIKNDTGTYKIYTDDIVFIETAGRNTLLHLTNKELVLSYWKMKEYEPLLSNSFYRCHNSYIVNLNFIDKVIQYDIYLLSGEIISVSKPRRKNFMIAFNEFYGRSLI